MTRPVVYDITRLVTRILNPVPNGIDRVDFALARHFLTRTDATALLCSMMGPRLVEPSLGTTVIDETEAWWKEQQSSAHDPGYEAIVARLTDPKPGVGPIELPRNGHVASVVKAFCRAASRIGRSPRRVAPRGACYVHANHFLLDRAWYLRWLEDRRDIRPVFFIHDLIPVAHPDFFWRGEPERHRIRLANLARLRAGAVVSSAGVAEDLRKHMASEGYSDAPICQATLPVSPVFQEPPCADPRLVDVPYFVICGTIEPRKNHLFLLEVWRELVRLDGPQAPKLVIVGKRGWGNENVIDLLERCKPLQSVVIEVSGLATPSLKRLLDNARALLMPSFAEGYGLPVAEALAAGVPVVASDLPAFREMEHSELELLDPLAGLAWLQTIRARGHERRKISSVRAPLQHPNQFFKTIDDFMSAL
jgi:glycosyltransferase involved in cell wall biosynthesis